MGERYEKNRKNVSDNRQTRERLRTDRDTLQKEYAPLSLLESVQALLEDEVSEAVQNVRDVGEQESERIDSETDTAEKERKQITDEVNKEIAKLNAGLEKLRRTENIQFGKSAVEKSRQEYKKQIDKFKKLIDELGEDVSDSVESGAAGAEALSASDAETTQPRFEMQTSYDNASPMPVRLSKLSDTIISKMNQNRVRAVDLAFSNAPQIIVDELNARADHLMRTEDTGYSRDKNGNMVKDGCYYSPYYHQVRMDESLDDEEYGEIIPHELFHFFDHERGWQSNTPEFTNALQADLRSMDKSTEEGRAKLNEMLDDAFSTGAAFDRNISDIISAVFVNDPEIVTRFYREGVPYYQHKNEYWADEFARETETYANCGAIFCSNERISINFLERYFTNIHKQFTEFYNLR